MYAIRSYYGEHSRGFAQWPGGVSQDDRHLAGLLAGECPSVGAGACDGNPGAMEQCAVSALRRPAASGGGPASYNFV